MDFHKFYSEPPQQLQSYLAEKEHIKLNNVGFIRQYPYSSYFNLNFHDEETRSKVVEDVSLFKKWGGGCIVENTSHGLKRDLDFCYEVSEKTGVHVVCGTGHYLSFVQSDSTHAMSIEAMSDLYTKEIITGNDLRGDGKYIVKCGFIGEVGSSWPINGKKTCFCVYFSGFRLNELFVYG